MDTAAVGLPALIGIASTSSALSEWMGAPRRPFDGLVAATWWPLLQPTLVLCVLRIAVRNLAHASRPSLAAFWILRSFCEPDAIPVRPFHACP